MRTFCCIGTSTLLPLALLTLPLGISADAPKSTALVVGWSDEFNGINWQPLPRPNRPDVSRPHRGRLRLSLGPGTVCVPKSVPFYWGSVSRVVDVDTSRYPILAVCADNLKGAAWWDVYVQGYTAPDSGLGFEGGRGGFPGQPPGPDSPVGAEVKTPSLDHGGVILFDLQAQNGLNLISHRVRLRLDIAGTTPGDSVEYHWVRFVRRQDAARLASDPRIRDIVVEP